MGIDANDERLLREIATTPGGFPLDARLPDAAIGPMGVLLVAGLVGIAGRVDGRTGTVLATDAGRQFLETRKKATS